MKLANHVADLLCSHKRQRNLLVYSFYLGIDGPGQAYMNRKCNLLADRVFQNIQQTGQSVLRVVDTSWFSQNPNFYGTDMAWTTDESGRMILSDWQPDGSWSKVKRVVTTNQFQGPPIFQGGGGFDLFLYPSVDSTQDMLGKKDRNSMLASLQPKARESDRVRISFHADKEFGNWLLGYVLPEVATKEVRS